MRALGSACSTFWLVRRLLPLHLDVKSSVTNIIARELVKEEDLRFNAFKKEGLCLCLAFLFESIGITLLFFIIIFLKLRHVGIENNLDVCIGVLSVKQVEKEELLARVLVDLTVRLDVLLSANWLIVLVLEVEKQ